jgi:hypothetical protein
MPRLALALLFLACLSLTLAADEVVLKAGGKITGKIVEETSTHVKIRTKFGGVMTIKRASIKRVVRKKSKDDIYKEKLAKVSRKDVNALWELAEWCRSEGLGNQLRATLKLIISADPDHEKAREGLGYVRYKGRWVTRSALKRLEKDALAKEMKAKGMVKYKGKWVTKEERERLEKGLVLHEGRWITKEEKKFLDMGYVKYEGTWVTKEEKENREKGLYRVGRKWVDEAEANRHHSVWDTAWEVHGTGYMIRSTAPIKFLEKQREIVGALYEGMRKFCLGKKPSEDIVVHIYATIREYNGVQEQVMTDNMFYAHHSHSIGGVFKYTEPKFVVTYKNDTKEYQYMFLGHGVGEAYLSLTFEMDNKTTDHWFLLGPGHYLGITQAGDVVFNVKWVSQKLGDNILPLSTLLSTRELPENEYWCDRFYMQSALLIYMLLKDPRYAEKFKEARAEIFKTRAPSKVLRKHFDLNELERSMKKLLESGRPIPNEVKEP